MKDKRPKREQKTSSKKINDRHPKKLKIIESFGIASHSFKDTEDERDEES